MKTLNQFRTKFRVWPTLFSTGQILLCRDRIDEGLSRLKKACDLDPSDFNKGIYDKALQWASQPDEPEESNDQRNT